MENVGAKIKKIRKEHKDTLMELAAKIDYDYSNLSKVERGVYGVSVDLIKRISEVYNVNPNYFIGEGLTESEGNLLVEENLEPSDLKEKYRFNIDGVEATDEEIMEAVKLIRLLKQQKSLG